jgi:hypothetical protein
MIKIQMEWELANGQTFTEWTIPWEIAEAETATGVVLQSLAANKSEPSLDFLFQCAYQIQKRIDDKPTGSFDAWKKNVVHLEAVDYQKSNFTKLEASKEL